MNTERIFELIAMISQLKPLYPPDEFSTNEKMLKLINDLENLLIEGIKTNG